MRFLNRIKQPIFYAKYYGKTEITEEVDGKTLKTGDYEITYGGLEQANVFLSVPKSGNLTISGNATVSANGVSTSYRHRIISETDLGLNVEDIFVVGVANADGGLVDPWEEMLERNGGVFTQWEATQMLNGGGIQPWSGEEKLYQITAVQKSFHHTSYEVKEL